jgi:spore coat polysaccharide biosynthesis protein SpsF
MRDAAVKYKLDWVLSVTADNPWVCPLWADRLLSVSVQNDWDFGKISGLPFGAFSYVLKTEAIVRACKIKDEVDTEVWGGYFKSEFGFASGVLDVPKDSIYFRPDYRFTVDTQEDFDLAQTIVSHFPDCAKDSPVGLDRVIRFIDQNPKLLEINGHIIQAHARPIKIKNHVV